MSAINALLKLLSSFPSQQHRLLQIDFPNNDAPSGIQLLANSLHATEAISRDFIFDVELLGDRSDLELKQMLGKLVTLSLTREDGTQRYFNGYVTDFQFIKNDAGLSIYHMTLQPWLALLRHRKNNTLYQNLSLLQQTEQIFQRYAMRDWNLLRLNDDDPITFSAQFDESDYNYLHRHWEAYGWSYWYEHRADGHTLILSADTAAALAIDGTVPHIPWEGRSGMRQTGIWNIRRGSRITPSLYALSSFNFKRPQSQVVDIAAKEKTADLPEFEVYEYAGAYGFDHIADGNQQAQLRIEAIEAQMLQHVAEGNHAYAQAGRWFKLTGGRLGEVDVNRTDNPASQQFLILQIEHTASNNYHVYAQGGSKAAEYRNQFQFAPRQVKWRPERGFNSTATKIYGLQTALVVGPSGQEIHTDEYGRIKIQFHWDREGTYDQASSAWVRVATSWAGSNFGIISIPRIGQEVVVQFLDGNPDRPLITGTVYNAYHMPPWALPANQTQSGILTRSSPGGTAEHANALRFEDKKGAEEVWLHAEKDQRIEVENDESHWVGHDRSKTVDNNETVGIGVDRTETVGNNETIKIGRNRTETVGSNETISIGRNRTESVGKSESVDIGSHRKVTVGRFKVETVGAAKFETIGLAKVLSIGAAYKVNVGAIMSTHVGMSQTETVAQSKKVKVGTTYHVEVAEQFKLTVGKSSITLHANGTIELQGSNLMFEASEDQRTTAKGNIVLKAKKIMEN